MKEKREWIRFVLFKAAFVVLAQVFLRSSHINIMKGGKI